MSVSILVVADEPDVADLFRQEFRREAVRGNSSCILPPPERKRSTGSRTRSGPS